MKEELSNIIKQTQNEIVMTGQITSNNSMLLNNKEIKFRDDNILVDGINGKRQGFLFFMEEICLWMCFFTAESRNPDCLR